MKIDNDIENLKGDRTYTRYDLIEIFRKEYKELNDATFRWMLYNMQLHKGLFRVKLVPTAKKLMPDVEMDIAVESYSYKTMKQDRNVQKRPYFNMRMRSF